MTQRTLQPVEMKKIAVKFKGNQVVQLKYERKKGFTRDEILNAAQEYSNKLKEKGFNGSVAVSIKYHDKDGGEWRGGYSRPVGKDVLIYSRHDSDENMEEPDSFPEFRMYTIKNGAKIGKASKNNDCLFYAIKNVLHNEFIFKKPEELKTFLKIDRQEGIHIDKIPKLEKHLGMRINVSGDHLHTSSLPGLQEINLTLIDGHYDVDKIRTFTTRGIAKTEKKPLIVSIENEVYNGKKTWTMSKDELTDIRKYPNKAKYIIIRKSTEDHSSLEEIYDRFIKDADILKEETKGVINMYKTGSDTKTASHFFEHFSRSYHVDDISQNEAEYINNASVGALIFSERYEGPLYEYDVCSMYPSIMTDSHMLFPLKEGTWMKYTQKEFDNREFYVYGIYRCKVNPSGKRRKDRLFRFNADNHYTHFDLNMAQQLGFEVEMIVDSQPNLLHYPRDCLINGHKLFYKYIIMLFKMKEKSEISSRAKSILNTLWGYLTSANVIEKIVKESDDELTEIYDNRNIHMICPLKNGSLRIQITKNEKIFETNYARIKPFLLARGRKMITDLILKVCPNQKDVVRTHTDSILSKTPLKLENSKYKLGSLVFKQSSEHAIVHNSVFVEW